MRVQAHQTTSKKASEWSSEKFAMKFDPFGSNWFPGLRKISVLRKFASVTRCLFPQTLFHPTFHDLVQKNFRQHSNFFFKTQQFNVGVQGGPYRPPNWRREHTNEKIGIFVVFLFFRQNTFEIADPGKFDFNYPCSLFRVKGKLTVI